MLTKKSLPPPQPPGPSQPPPMNLHNGSHNFKAKDPLFLRQENRAFLSLPNQINGVQTTGPQGCRCQSPSRGRARVREEPVSSGTRWGDGRSHSGMATGCVAQEEVT